MEIEKLSNVKLIVKQVYRQCLNMRIIIAEDFITFYVKLLLLDPGWRISDDEDVDSQRTQVFVHYCVKMLFDGHNPVLKTLQIQHSFLAHTSGETDYVEANRKMLKKYVKPLEDDIFQISLADLNRSDEHRLFDRMVLYITVLAGLGNPEEDTVMQEANFALKSLFSDSDLEDFVQLKPDEKLTELAYLQNLVTGIRLFNRDCGRPAAPIEDLPKLLSDAFLAIQSMLQTELLQIMERVNVTTSAIENVYKLEENDETGYCLKLCLPEGVTPDFLRFIMDTLVLSRQYEVYIRKLLTDIQVIENSGTKLFNELQEIFIKLHASVKLKIAIPTSVVYPLFAELSDVWKKMQDQIVLLSAHNKVFQQLQIIYTSDPPNEKFLHKLIDKGEILTDAKRLERTTGLKIKEEDNECEVLDPLRIKDFDKIPLQYLGFCAWSLIETKGGLIPGNPNMGICKWNEKYYVFSSPEAAYAFGLDPETCVLKALEGIRTRPELINLMQLHEQICSLRQIGVLYEQPATVVLTHTVGIQTEVHPVPSYIDPKYTSNIWDMYRQAIKLANITNCKTHSTQTDKSHFRYPVHSQTSELRAKECQTKSNNYTNVATPMNFIFGLRGRRDDSQHVLDLTRPVDEAKHYQCATATDYYPFKHFARLSLHESTTKVQNYAKTKPRPPQRRTEEDETPKTTTTTTKKKTQRLVKKCMCT